MRTLVDGILESQWLPADNEKDLKALGEIPPAPVTLVQRHDSQAMRPTEPTEPEPPVLSEAVESAYDAKQLSQRSVGKLGSYVPAGMALVLPTELAMLREFYLTRKNAAAIQAAPNGQQMKQTPLKALDQLVLLEHGTERLAEIIRQLQVQLAINR